jgi:hypothetical protein
MVDTAAGVVMVTMDNSLIFVDFSILWSGRVLPLFPYFIC